MAISITPAVIDWVKQINTFVINIKAYDNNGIQCKGEQMGIKYAVSYDGTIPDISSLNTVYGDASGQIAITILNPCVITLYGFYERDVTNPSMGKTEQEIVSAYKITFEPSILSMSAEYKGRGVYVTDNFNLDDIKITAYMSDSSTKEIPSSWCDFDSYTVSHAGENVFHAEYYDPQIESIWNMDFIITGLEKLLSLDATYTGDTLSINSRVYEDDIDVYGTFLIEKDVTERRKLDKKEWEFVTIPVVMDENNGIFTIKSGSMTTTVSVPYIMTESIRLNVWYEGAKIEIPNMYDKENVVVYVIEPDGARYRISYKDVEFDSTMVTEEGWNWFTATYRDGYRKIRQIFPVYGIIYKKYVDLPFKVLYIKDNEKIDMTSDFFGAMEFEGSLNITWKKFLEEVNRQYKELYNKCYGRFIMTAPKLSGLSTQYDTDWEIVCTDETTLSARIIKIYNEEDTGDGQKKEE